MYLPGTMQRKEEYDMSLALQVETSIEDSQEYWMFKLCNAYHILIGFLFFKMLKSLGLLN